jgi:hypothetical protein
MKRLARALLPALLVLLPATVRAQDIFAEKADTVSPEVDRMYRKGLSFLVSTQTAQGNWSENYGQQPAVVGLAVLAMLAHGDDPNYGPYKEPIRRGLTFILNKQRQDNGYIGDSMYNHGFATLALAEAYGSVDEERLGPALEKAVGLLVSTAERNPQGAWRYSPESRDADTTVSGACLVALLAARNAGVAVPDKTIDKALAFYTRCQTADGGFGYTSASGPNAPRSAIGALVFVLAKKKDSKQFRAGAKYCRNQPYGGAQSHYRFYYLYYMSQAMFQISGEDWQKWNRQNVERLRLTQAPDGRWNDQFGPTFATASGLLSLALNYRFLPIYER